jgi:repressor LexA
MPASQRNYRQEILTLLTRYITDHGYPPTFEEIRQSLGLSSKSHVGYHIAALEEAGLVERKRYSPRSLHVVGLEAPGRKVGTGGNR